MIRPKHELLIGDVMDVLPTLEADNFDAMLTDPPYGLEFMGKEWDGRVPSPDVWRECLRVLKPGAFALVFGGTRTFHRLAVALEDAGFELRDTLMWLHSQGFPKSHDVSKGIDKLAGAERKVIGPNPNHRAASGVNYEGIYAGGNTGAAHITAPATPEAERWQGYSTSLKPAYEPILLVRKPTPLTYAQNALEHGTGALNIDGCRVPTDDRFGGGAKGSSGFVSGYEHDGWKPGSSLGRWPANVLTDGSDEVDGLFPCSGAGSASRFYFTAKASVREKNAGVDGKNTHVAVKPLALTEYLAKLLLPPERDTPRRLLVPFAGSGSEMIGAGRAGWDEVVGIEREAEYVAIAEQRLAHWLEAA